MQCSSMASQPKESARRGLAISLRASCFAYHMMCQRRRQHRINGDFATSAMQCSSMASQPKESARRAAVISLRGSCSCCHTLQCDRIRLMTAEFAFRIGALARLTLANGIGSISLMLSGEFRNSSHIHYSEHAPPLYAPDPVSHMLPIRHGSSFAAQADLCGRSVQIVAASAVQWPCPRHPVG
jgi:hypothetical protein